MRIRRWNARSGRSAKKRNRKHKPNRIEWTKRSRQRRKSTSMQMKLCGLDRSKWAIQYICVVGCLFLVSAEDFGFRCQHWQRWQSLTGTVDDDDDRLECLLPFTLFGCMQFDFCVQVAPENREKCFDWTKWASQKKRRSSISMSDRSMGIEFKVSYYVYLGSYIGFMQKQKARGRGPRTESKRISEERVCVSVCVCAVYPILCTFLLLK